MSEKANTGVTLFDLAQLFATIDAGSSHPARRTLRRVVEGGPYAELYAELQRAAKDSGTSQKLDGWEWEAYSYWEEFDRLVAAPPGWTVPEDVLDIDGSVGVEYQPLISICRARLARGEGDAERLGEIEALLRAAGEAERRSLDRAEKARTQVLEGFRELISCPEKASTAAWFSKLLAECKELLDQVSRPQLLEEVAADRSRLRREAAELSGVTGREGLEDAHDV
jgi:hypothetical protein